MPMPCRPHPLPCPGLWFEARGQPPTAGSGGRSLGEAAGSPVTAKWGVAGRVWWGGIWGGAKGISGRPEGQPDRSQLSPATYLGSQAVSWVAVQVNFLRKEEVLAAERMESVSGSMWCVAEEESPPPRQRSPLPSAVQSLQGCYQGRSEMGELEGLGPGVPAGLAVSLLLPPKV